MADMAAGNTLPTGAAGGLAGLFGLAGPATGTAGGSGIFTQLLAGAEAATPAPVAAGVAPVADSAGTGIVVMPLLPPAAVSVAEAGAPAFNQMEMRGASKDITALMARLQAMTETLEAAGISMDTLTQKMATGTGSEQLAAALEAMGLSPAEAKAQAEKIEAALKMAKDNMKLADDQMAMMAALLLGSVPGATAVDAALPEGEAVAFTVEVTVVEVKVSSLKAYAAGSAPAVDARALMGLGNAEAGMDMAAGEDVAEDWSFLLDDEGFALMDGADAVVEAAKPDMARVAAAQNAQAVVQAPAVPQAALAAEVQAAVAPARVASKIAREDVLGKPEGEVLYQWRGEESGKDTGVERVDATPAAHKAMETLLGTQKQSGDTLGMVGDKAVASAFGQFSDRLASAMRGDAVGQVNVQMKSLGEQGGGTVRMMLNPESLGEVHIELTIGRDGSVNGSISASDSAVVELLAREVHQLRNGLENAGLKLGQEGINLMLSSNGQQNNPNGQPAGMGGGFGEGGQGQHGQQHAYGTTADGDASAVDVDLSGWVNPERLVDVRV